MPVPTTTSQPSSTQARHAIRHWLDVTDMETAVHGRRPTPDHIRIALLEEAAKPHPAPVAEILAPFKAEVDALSRGFTWS